MRVIVFDKTENDAPRLSSLWRIGARFPRAYAVIPAASWNEVYYALGFVGAPVTDLQVWGPGVPGSPLLNGQNVDLVRLAAVGLSGATVWFRGCDVALGDRGQAFMIRASHVLKASVVAHCDVIAWTNPLWQAKLCGIRPGEAPWWSKTGDELRGCGTLRVKLPQWAFRA